MTQTAQLAIAYSRMSVGVILAAVVTAYILAIAFVLDLARLQDEKSLAQTTDTVKLLILEKQERLKQTMGDYADWGAAYEHLHKTLDVAWAFDQGNVGPSLLDDLGIEYAGVFDPSGREAYTVVDGTLSPDHVLSNIAGVSELVGQARALHNDAVASGVLRSGGDAVLAAAKVISPGKDATVQEDGRPPTVLLFGDRLTAVELLRIRDSLNLERLKLVPAPITAPKQSLFLKTSDGNGGFLLDVSAPRPGRDMVRGLLPSFTAVGLVFGALLLWLGRQGLKHATSAKESAAALEESHRSLEQTALYDALTGLPNRRLFSRRLTEALGSPTPVTVLFLDLDRFKPINDSYGHEAGDYVLREVGRRLTSCVSGQAICARLGGDEFVILTNDLDEVAVHKTCRDILRAVSADIPYGGQLLHVGVSIGITQTRPGEDKIEDVLRRADYALYDAKKRGRSRFRWFNDTPQASVASA